MMRLANTVGYRVVHDNCIIYLLIQMVVVSVGVIEGANHEASEQLALRGHTAVVQEEELSREKALLKHHFVHHFFIIYNYYIYYSSYRSKT